MRQFSLCQLAPTPWRNGGGLTREIAIGTADGATASAWDWRLSVASILTDGPFSSFYGIDRIATLVDGVVRLESRSSVLAWTSQGEAHGFDGEEKFFCRLGGASARLFNVMVRRDAVVARVTTHDRSVAFAASEALQQRCVLVLNGQFKLETSTGTVSLDAENGLLWSAPTSATATMVSNSGCLVDVQVRRRTDPSTRPRAIA